MVNQKLTYISVFGEQSSIEEAYALSEACTAKLEDSFNKIDVKDLIDLAKFMVSRKN
jgi:predicted nucleotidyltransferase component of viral defense system